MKSVQVARCFAPASVGNVAVGFDLLGFALNQVGDEVTAKKIPERTVKIGSIEGLTTGIPANVSKNTATVGLLALIQDLSLDFGFEISIKKGIPLGSGMGGSAASAIGGIVAANALLEKALSKEQLLAYALQGESIASGSAHLDNLAPCLFGGLVLSKSTDPIDVISIPVPKDVVCTLVHPKMKLETKTARAVLRNEISLKMHVEQSALLAGFISGCFTSDLGLIKRSLADVVVEPQRAHLIPGFFEVKRAALQKGALGCSISGAGPSVFGWFASIEEADAGRLAMIEAFEKAGLQATGWSSAINQNGARLIE